MFEWLIGWLCLFEVFIFTINGMLIIGATMR